MSIYVPPVSNENITANNALTKFVKVFTIRDKILLVVDDDGMFCTDSGVWPDEITNALEACGFQVFVWSETEMGRPALSLLLDTLGVVWHCGTYMYPAVDYTDAEMLIQYVAMGGSLVLEGENIGWDRGRDQFMLEVAHAFFGTYLAIYDFTVTAPTHPVTKGLPSRFSAVVSGLSPDGVYPTNGGVEVVRYTLSPAYSGIVVFESMTIRTVYISFSVHYLSSSIRDQLIENSVKYAVSRDDVPPTIFITSPEDGAMINTTSVQVSWYGDDDESGIDHYSIYLNEGLMGNTNASTTSWWLSDLLPGPNNVTVIAYDEAGNYASDQITVIVDLIQPTAEIIAPENESYLRDAVIIVVNGCDTYFDYMKLYINDELIATLNDDGANVYVWETSFMEDETYTIKLVVYDKAENYAEAFVTVIVDNTSPNITWILPSNGSYISGVVNLTFSYYDSNLHKATLLLDGRTLANVTGETFYLWKTSEIADGEHILTLMVLDKAGNRVDESVTLVMDNTKPDVNIVNSAELIGAELEGVVTIQFSSSDTNLEGVLLYIDETVINVTGQSSYEWNTTEVGDGTHAIRLVAYDKAGNMAETPPLSVRTVNVQKANQENYWTGWDFGLKMGVILGLVIGLVIGLVVLLALRKKPEVSKI